MRYIPRVIQETVESYMQERYVLAITGMRRVGKTTMLKYLYDCVPSSNKLYFNLEDVLTRKMFSQDNYQDIKRALEHGGISFDTKAYIFLDEIQFIPQVTSVIKYLYDEYDIKFVTTGSSSYYLKNHFSESLAGRKLICELHPLTFREFLAFKGVSKRFPQTWHEKAMHLNEWDEGKYKALYQEYIDFGGFPEVVLQPKEDIKRALLRDIVNSYFQIDVATLADFDDIAQLRDLLILLTQRIGSRLNVTNLANVFHIQRQQVYAYLSFLEATYVIRLISRASSADNSVSSEDKVYFTDTGIARLLADISEGAQFENSVYMNCAYMQDIRYYQTLSGGEIDFVVDGAVALEAKIHPERQDVTNLAKRAQSAGVKEHYIVGFCHVPFEGVCGCWDV